MAFTGTPVVQQITDQTVRITGLSLALSASGTIGLFGDGGAGVQLPESFKPNPYSAPAGYGPATDGVLSQADVVDASVVIADAASALAKPVGVTKGGSPFRVTVTNPDGTNASGALEIWVKYHV